VLDAEDGGEDDAEIRRERDEHGDVLLVHRRVHEEGEDREEQVLGKLQPDSILSERPSWKSW
jgi:hypothetical protein